MSQDKNKPPLPGSPGQLHMMAELKPGWQNVGGAYEGRKRPVMHDPADAGQRDDQ